MGAIVTYSVSPGVINLIKPVDKVVDYTVTHACSPNPFEVGSMEENAWRLDVWS
jgi:hypothetical protein